MAELSGRTRRVLSKAEAATALGADLLALCQTVTADGVLTPDETQAITVWLAENEAAAAEIPAIRFLLETVRRIASDGHITPDERRELQRAVEVVMPKASKETAIAARRTADERLAPVLRCDFMVKFVSHHQREIDGLAEGDRLVFCRDPENKFDANAILVQRANRTTIGYVPREDAAEMAPLLDAQASYRARCKKIIGYKYATPVVLADIFRPGVAVPDADVARRDKPTIILPSGREYRPSAARGAMMWLVIAAALVFTCVAFTK